MARLSPVLFVVALTVGCSSDSVLGPSNTESVFNIALPDDKVVRSGESVEVSINDLRVRGIPNTMAWVFICWSGKKDTYTLDCPAAQGTEVNPDGLAVITGSNNISAPPGTYNWLLAEARTGFPMLVPLQPPVIPQAIPAGTAAAPSDDMHFAIARQVTYN